MKKVKQPEFTVHVHADILYEARIRAADIKEALEKTQSMKHNDLWALPGEILDDSNVKITAVFE